MTTAAGRGDDGARGTRAPGARRTPSQRPHDVSGLHEDMAIMGGGATAATRLFVLWFSEGIVDPPRSQIVVPVRSLRWLARAWTR